MIPYAFLRLPLTDAMQNTIYVQLPRIIYVIDFLGIFSKFIFAVTLVNIAQLFCPFTRSVLLEYFDLWNVPINRVLSLAILEFVIHHLINYFALLSYFSPEMQFDTKSVTRK
jgi:hypothetical protein